MNSSTPPPMPAYPPPPPPPPVKTKNVYVIAGAAVLITAIVTTGVVVVNGQDDAGNANANSTSSPTPGEAITASPVVSVPPIGEEDKPDPVKLTDTVTYRNDVEVSLRPPPRGIRRARFSSEHSVRPLQTEDRQQQQEGRGHHRGPDQLSVRRRRPRRGDPGL
ncbi:hypothetical protein [Streptomyces sp. NPDC048825]|uniref:hypothetical protein n=1 Tax=Streptomyces sp. NPDC048825 TaxID=3365592 RepID=UPI00370FAB7C